MRVIIRCKGRRVCGVSSTFQGAMKELLGATLGNTERHPNRANGMAFPKAQP
jgi:hypothetical protein